MMYQFLTTFNNGKGKGMLQRVFEYTDKEGMQAFIEEYKHHDTYKTISLYKKPTVRKAFNIGDLIAFVIDVEAVGHAFDITLSDAKALVKHMEQDFNKTMPEPTKIIHSGRGLHVYFDIEPIQDIKKYQLVLSRLQEVTDEVIAKYDALSEAKHDPSVDYYSLIRVEGTKNTLAGVYTSVIYHNLTRYNVDYLIKNYLPDLKDTIGHTKRAYTSTNKKHQKKYRPFKKEFVGYNKSFTKETLQKAVMQDLQTLRELRVNNKRFKVVANKNYKKLLLGNEGDRNIMIFYYGLYAKHLYQDTNKVYEAMSAFNDSFLPNSLSKSELERTFKSVLSPTYGAPTNKKMITKLSISEEEMAHMSVVISSEHKKKRHIKTVAKYKKKISHERAADKKELINKVNILHAQGLSYRDISRVLKISLGSVHNYLK